MSRSKGREPGTAPHRSAVELPRRSVTAVPSETSLGVFASVEELPHDRVSLSALQEHAGNRAVQRLLSARPRSAGSLRGDVRVLPDVRRTGGYVGWGPGGAFERTDVQRQKGGSAAKLDPSGSTFGDPFGGGFGGPFGGGFGGAKSNPKLDPFGGGLGGALGGGTKAGSKVGPGPEAGPADEEALIEEQAKKDLIAFTAKSYTFPGFTKGINGKFDVTYIPSARLLDINVKVKFDFVGAGWGLMDRLIYPFKFMAQAGPAWSGQHPIHNVREPKSIWGPALNPVNVNVRVTPVKTDQHFTVRFHKGTGGAEVHKGVTKLFEDDMAPSQAFNPVTAAGEIARIERITPKTIDFGLDADHVPAAVAPKLDFLAEYLRRVNRPPVTLTVEGWASTDGAAKYNFKLSERRARAVADYLSSKGLTNHTIVVVPRGERGAGPGPKWRKATITPSIDPTWKNTFNTITHEFGHMLGLGDEYQGTPGKVATHHGLVKQHFGQDYADQTVKRGDVASGGVMHFGDDIRVHHYVTMWSALAETTLKAPVPKPPFGYNDWKIQG
ncbi:MAG: OmpA family protein [Actinobacteria bacterium]|nr:OmpA family protein [Actinomycetota bacterium]